MRKVEGAQGRSADYELEHRCGRRRRLFWSSKQLGMAWVEGLKEGPGGLQCGEGLVIECF